MSLLPESSAFAHGFGIFETIRYSDGNVFFWKKHWTRLQRSAKQFNLTPPKEDSVLTALREWVTTSHVREAILKLSLLKNTKKSQLYIYSRAPFPPFKRRNLLLDTTCPIFERSVIAGHKTHNYMEAMHLHALANACGYYDILRLDSRGNLAETTTANLFFVQKGRLHTPSLQTGILPGVIRSVLLQCPDLNIRTGLYPPDVLQEADAVFITNANTGMVRIDEISGLPHLQPVNYKENTFDFESLFERLEQFKTEQTLKLSDQLL